MATSTYLLRAMPAKGSRPASLSMPACTTSQIASTSRRCAQDLRCGIINGDIGVVIFPDGHHAAAAVFSEPAAPSPANSPSHPLIGATYRYRHAQLTHPLPAYRTGRRRRGTVISGEDCAVVGPTHTEDGSGERPVAMTVVRP